MRARVGRHHDALADLAVARALAQAAGDGAAEVEILLDEATALDWTYDYKSSAERIEEARSLSGALRSPLLAARLHLGIGRSLHRVNREAEAVDLLELAAEEAAALGDAGYETWVVARVMLGFIYQGLDRLDEARRAIDQAITRCEAHGDDYHLAGAINNRALLWALLGDRAALLADMERGLALARKLGQAPLELITRFNLGEALYLMDDTAAAEPHVRRALEISRRLHGGSLPVVALLDARLRLYLGEEAEARAIVDRIRAQQEEAYLTSKADMLMAPAEDVLCAAIELATRDATAAEWDALEERSARSSVGQERLEVLDLRALAALRRGRAEEAAAVLGRALAAAERIPNMMGPRLRRRREAAEARR
jgi:tetratricopeptide (TPR) repeat protein